MYMEKIEKVILSDEFILKKSRRYNVLTLINHPQKYRKDDIKRC